MLTSCRRAAELPRALSGGLRWAHGLIYLPEHGSPHILGRTRMTRPVHLISGPHARPRLSGGRRLMLEQRGDPAAFASAPGWAMTA